jgi:hypothetical protein
VGLERGPLNLVSTIEELLEKKSSGSGLENRDYGLRDPPLYPQRLTLTSPTSGSCSVGIACSRTKATEFMFLSLYFIYIYIYIYIYACVCVCVYRISNCIGFVLLKHAEARSCSCAYLVKHYTVKAYGSIEA